MNDLLTLSPGPLALFDALAKATVVLAAAAVLTTLLGRASAASRHLVWTAALLSALALPLLASALPRWQLAVVTIAAPASPPRFIGTDAAPDVTAPAVGARTAPARTRSAAVVKTSVARPAIPWRDLSWTLVFAAIWAAGGILILGRLASGIVAVAVMSRRTTPATGAPWLPLARGLAGEMGITRVAFRRSAHSTMPMTWGIIRPEVVLPEAADTWPAERVRIALLHELAHVRRRDCLTHILGQIACACYWMNPLTWLAAGRARAERERACDDLVIAFGTDGADYADELLAIARGSRAGLCSTTAASASLAMARRSQLEGRLMAILDPSVPRTGVSRLRTATAVLVALLALVPLASMQTWAVADAAMVPQLPLSNPQPPASSPRQPAGTMTTEPVRRARSEGSVQQVTEAIAERVRQGVARSLPAAIEEAVMAQQHNPNPNPNPNPDVRGMKSKADPKVVAALTAALDDTDNEVRESAMHALVQLRDPGVYEPLVRALKDPSADVRESAVHGLAQLRDRRAVTPMIGMLKDTSASVREQAVFALGQLRDPAAIEPLVGAVRDESASVREQAAFALGQIRDERAIEPLLALMRDPADSVREQTVFALGQIRSPRGVDPLIAALKDEKAEVRGQAAFALGQIRDARAIDALSNALKDPSTEVRRQAAFALGRLAR